MPEIIRNFVVLKDQWDRPLRRATAIARHIFVEHFLCSIIHRIAALYTLSPCFALRSELIGLSASVSSAAFSHSELAKTKI